MRKTWLACTLLLSACAAEPKAELSKADTLSKNYPIALQKIADGVWVHTSNYTVPGRPPISSNGLIVEDGDSLIMVDTAWGEKLTESLKAKAEAEIGKPITKVIVTHHHADRLAGVDYMELEGAEVFTHPRTPVLAWQKGFAVPNTSVASLKVPKSRTKVGTVELTYPGPGHAEDNLVVYVPAAKILYGGCAIKGAESLGLGTHEAEYLTAWPESLNWIKSTYHGAETVVPGHGKGGSLKLVDHTLGLLAAKVNADKDKAEDAEK